MQIVPLLHKTLLKQLAGTGIPDRKCAPYLTQKYPIPSKFHTSSHQRCIQSHLGLAPRCYIRLRFIMVVLVSLMQLEPLLIGQLNLQIAECKMLMIVHIPEFHLLEPFDDFIQLRISSANGKSQKRDADRPKKKNKEFEDNPWNQPVVFFMYCFI